MACSISEVTNSDLQFEVIESDPAVLVDPWAPGAWSRRFSSGSTASARICAS
jgi:hypothetical protein